MDYALHTGRSWKGDFLVADVEELQENDASKTETISYSDLLAVPQSWKEKFLKSEHPTEFGKTSKKEKNTAAIFKEKRMNHVLQSNNENKTTWKRSRRQKLYVPEESSFPLPLKFIEVVRRTKTTLDVSQECQIHDYRNVTGDWILSGQWTSSTLFTLLKNTPLRGYTLSGERLTEIQVTSRPENMWRDIWSGMSKKSQQKESSDGQKQSQSSTIHGS